jgi:ribosomal protein S18 acetylase RimI-like enzyme
MTVSILPIAEEHIEDFRAAMDVVARELKYLAFLEAPPLDDVAVFVRGNIEKGHPQFVAVSDARVVGWADVIPNYSRPIYRHSGVFGMGVVPDFRDKGIGKALMRRTIDAGFAFGLTRIELTVRENNVGAIELYKKFGFAIEGLHRNAVCIEGHYENKISMALLKG